MCIRDRANITLLFGYQMAGALGGICAAIGLCIPAVVTLTIVDVYKRQMRACVR